MSTLVAVQTTPAATPATATTWRTKLAIAARDIKLSHSVFALPFAVLGAFLAAPRTADGPIAWPRFGAQLTLIVVCMFFARTFAMLVNRVADRRFDAANARTARRAFAAGTLSARDGAVMLLGCTLAFMLACAGFGVLDGNWVPLVASPLLLAWLALYSFTKRFTALCHVFLGGALAASPIAAAVAVGGLDALAWPANDPSSAPGPALWLIAVMVLVWVAGFDVIYAFQDLDFDRGRGLHSIPAKLGRPAAAWVSRGLHAVAVAALIGAGLLNRELGILFFVGVASVTALLVLEHAVLVKRGDAGIPMAFFTLNGFVSVVLGTLGALDTIVT